MKEELVYYIPLNMPTTSTKNGLWRN